MEPMIRGQKVVLSAEAQRAVAAWASLKVLVARYAHNPPEPVEGAWIDHLYRNHRPPPSWLVWIATYSGGEPIYYEGRDITVEFQGLGHEQTPHGVLATMVVGRLALKVLGVRAGTPPYRRHDAIIRIGPLSDLYVYWPMEAPLDDEGLVRPPW
jgi:hypothetical protein